MKKLKALIERAYQVGKLPYGIPLASFRILENVYDTLSQKQTKEFISSDVKMVLDKCGIKTRERGIGWVAYR